MVLKGHRFGGLLAFIFGITGCVQLASAQEPAATLLRAAERNWYVRATLSDEQVIAGRIRALYRDSVSIAEDRVALASIAGVERRVRAGGGWKSGAILGAAAMGTFVWFVYHGLCYTNCRFPEAAGSVLLGASVGIVIGSFAGEAAHPAEHAWVRIWP